MGKKGRKGADDWEADFAVDESGELLALKEAPADEPEAPAAGKKKEKKGKKDKKGKKVAAFESEDDEPTLAPPPADDEEDDEEAPVTQTKQRSKKKKGGVAGGSVFALLNGDGEEEEEEEQEEEAEEEQPAAKAPVMCVAEVVSVAPHPKSERLRVCQVDSGGLATAKVVTNAQNVEEGMKVVFAPVGCTTRSGMHIEQAMLRGVESFGMLCSAHECGWVSEPDGVLVVLPEDAEVGEECPEEPPEGAVYGAVAKKAKKDEEKKKKKNAKPDTDSLFAALAGDGEEEEAEEEAPSHKPSKKVKKKKHSADVGSAFAALSMADEEVAEEEEEEEAPAPKKDKKKEKKKKLAEADSLFAVLGGDQGEEEPEEEAPKKEKKKKDKKAYADIDVAALLASDEAPAPAPEPAGKKGKKKGKAPAEEEDLDALLAELDGPAAPAAPAPEAGAGKKGKKKKGKGGAKQEEEEDLDALLAELGAAPAAEQPPAAAQQAAAPAAAEQAEGGEEEEGEGEGEGDEKGMSAAAKRKAKKKAKEKAKKAGAAGEEAEEAGAEGAAAGKGGKKGGPKVSAAVRRMQEALEAQRKAQEEAERLAEEQRLREEEEERQREEEERRKKEEAERKRLEKAERREQLKREGKLLTGKAKEEAERRARAAQQFLKQAGLNPDELPKKKPVYASKKKPQKKKHGEEQQQQQEEQQQQQPEAAAAPAAEQPPAAEAAAAEPAAAEEQPAAEEPAVESWEDAADDWEAMDVDQIKLPGQQDADPHAGEDESEEEEEARPAPPAANGKAAAASAASAKAAAAVKAADTAVAAAKAAVEEGSSEDEDESDTSGSSEEGSSEDDSSDEDSSDYSSSEEESDSEDERERRLAAARERREAKLAEALAQRDPRDLRSPICCILGHVDTGKTKILDNIRRTNVQDGEAGGITQQIGATYIPASAVEMRTEELRKGRQFDLKLPGLLVIDTPGHESFSNLRSRGSGLCDIAILVVDLMHGLEQQTIESINLLKMRKTPFIIAMNKVDRLYKWHSVPNSPIQDAMARQEEYVRKEFETRFNQVALELNEQGLNVALYWKNRDPRSFISIVPTSAITGEGIPDLLQLVVKLTQSLMAERLMFVNNLECTVLEVKQIEGLGTTIDVVLVNGMLREGDTIVVCGLGGPIVTTIRALLTPQPLREIRVKGQYVHHKELRAAMGVKIAAHNLESAVAGTQLYVAGGDDEVEDLRDAVMEDMQDIFSSVDKTGEGVCVQASTLGSLEALLEFLRSDDVQIPVSSINIGPINKKDVMRANAMIERGHKKYGVILAFDVPVTREAGSLAEQLGVRIFTADIIYHLFDQFTAYLKQVKEEEQEAAKLTAVFPCVLKIIPTCVFNQKDPIILGVEVAEGIAKVGTPICVPSRGGVDLGRIASLEKDHKPVEVARRGDAVAMKIESTKPEEASRSYERHFDHRDELVSRITRKSIDVLKEMFRDELSKDDWRLVVKLKKIFKID